MQNTPHSVYCVLIYIIHRHLQDNLRMMWERTIDAGKLWQRYRRK